MPHTDELHHPAQFISWGLAPDVFETAEATLPSIRGVGEFNHLSVRSAVAITLDRLLGAREDGLFY